MTRGRRLLKSGRSSRGEAQPASPKKKEILTNAFSYALWRVKLIEDFEDLPFGQVTKLDEELAQEHVRLVGRGCLGLNGQGFIKLLGGYKSLFESNLAKHFPVSHEPSLLNAQVHGVNAGMSNSTSEGRTLGRKITSAFLGRQTSHGLGFALTKIPGGSYASNLMENHDLNLVSRFRGAVLGGAVADALALPYQHYSRAFLRSLATPIVSQFHLHHGGFYPLGQYSDETQAMLSVLASILDAGEVSREAMVKRLASLWRDQLLVEPERSIADALNSLKKGISGWQKTGLEPGRAEAAPAARVIPVALWDHDHPDELSRDVEACARITHNDPRSIAGALAVAGAIASNVKTEELILGKFLDRVGDAASTFDPTLKEAVLDFPRILSLSEPRALRYFESLSPDDRYPASDEGLSGYSIPTVCTVLYYFLKSPYRYEKTVESCLRVGGQIDTPAFLAGAISGALVGESGIPAKLTEGLLNAGDIALSADQLYSAWLRRGKEEKKKGSQP